MCDICGESLHTAGICKQCQSTRPAYYALRSCVVYTDPARSALINLKYKRQVGLGDALALPLADFLQELGWKADIVLPIPLSEQRFTERGYNQVELIAHPLAQLVGWKYSTRALRRIRHTDSQVGLGADARRKNVTGAFVADARLVSGKILLLIDDTTTTGATLDAASRSLLDAGADRVYALTFAKALAKNSLNFPSS